MSEARPVVVVTGISGHLGARLHPYLQRNFSVAAIDRHMPDTGSLHRLATLDLTREDSCPAMVELFSELRPTAVVHLAAAETHGLDGSFDAEGAWRLNVAGTARVMEAIAVHNRMKGELRRFVCLTSSEIYGPEAENAREDAPLTARDHDYLPAALQQEKDEVVRYRAEQLGLCACYLLRPQPMLGDGARNPHVEMLHAEPRGPGKRAQAMRRKGKKLSLTLPLALERNQRMMQYAHVDDVARLIAWLLEQTAPPAGGAILNVASRGGAVSFGEASELAGLRLKRAPQWLAQRRFRRMHEKGLISTPLSGYDYLLASRTVDCTALRRMLGGDYERVIRHDVAGALRDEFCLPSGEQQLDEYPSAPGAEQ